MPDDDGERESYEQAYAEAVSDIIAVRTLLMDNRPLEAISAASNAEQKHRERVPERFVQVPDSPEDAVE